MNRPSTAVFAVLEALLVVGVGVGLPVAALSLLWGFQYGLQIDWIVFWRAAVDVWLVGHGVDLTLTLAPEAAAATSLPGAEAPVAVTVAAFGFAVLTAVLGARAGRAIAETEHRLTGVLSSVGALAVLSTLLTLSARHEAASPSLPQGIVLPTLVYTVPLVVAAEVTRRRRGAVPDPVTGLVLRGLDHVPELALRVTAVALRLGSASVAAVLAVSALAVGLLVFVGYAELITLYEGAHAGYLGGLALTLAQLALVPVLVVWAASWFVGPGFALGTGSSVSPLGTMVGPLPAVPVLGALPTQDWSFAFVGIAVPVVAAFVAATLLRPRVVAALGVHDAPAWRALVGVGGGVVGGVALGLLAQAASGSAGPGRLAEVGPDPLLVGALSALELALPAALALAFDGRAFLGGGADDDAVVAAPVAAAPVAPAPVAPARVEATPVGATPVAPGRVEADASDAGLPSSGPVPWWRRVVPGTGTPDERDPSASPEPRPTSAPGSPPSPPPSPRVRLDRASERAALADAPTDEIPVVGDGAAPGADATAGRGRTDRPRATDGEDTERLDGLER